MGVIKGRLFRWRKLPKQGVGRSNNWAVSVLMLCLPACLPAFASECFWRYLTAAAPCYGNAGRSAAAAAPATPRVIANAPLSPVAGRVLSAGLATSATVAETGSVAGFFASGCGVGSGFESTPILLTPSTPPSSVLRHPANWPPRTQPGSYSPAPSGSSRGCRRPRCARRCRARPRRAWHRPARARTRTSRCP